MCRKIILILTIALTATGYLIAGDGYNAMELLPGKGIGTDPTRQIFVDLYGGQFIDFLHASGEPNSGLTLYRNNGTVGFELKPHWVGLQHLNNDPSRLNFVDVNCDGYNDLVRVSNLYEWGGISVHLNNGSGKIEAIHWSGLAGIGQDPSRQKFVDVNNDGYPDLVHVRGYPGGLNVYKNNGDGSFEEVYIWQGLMEIGTDPSRQNFMDMNSDGYPDLVHVRGYPGGINVYLNNKNWGFEEVYSWQGLSVIGTDPSRQNFVDINYDRLPDLVHVCGGQGGLLVHLNDGKGGFIETPHWNGLTHIGTDPARQNFVDMNNDGYFDLVHVCGGQGGLLVHLGDGKGGFIETPHWNGITEIGTDPARQNFIDVNNDQYPDLVHVCGGLGGILIHLGDKSGGFNRKADWFSNDFH